MSRKKDFRGQDAIDRLACESAKRSTTEGIADLAQAGDVECARRMALICSGHVYRAPSIPDVVKNYLCDCLERIGREESADKAFNLVSAKRGPKGNYWKEVRDLDLARHVRYLLQTGAAANVDEAAEKAATSYGAFAARAGLVGKDAAKDAYQRFFPAGPDKN